MNKLAAVSLSAVVWLGSTSPVLANVKSQPIVPVAAVADVKDMSSQDFIQTYAGTKITIQDSLKATKEEWIWFKEANRENYQLLLDGNSVFNQLSEPIQKEILASYNEQKIDYFVLIDNAKNIKEQIDQENAKIQEEIRIKEQQEAQNLKKQEEEAKAAKEANKAAENSNNQPADEIVQENIQNSPQQQPSKTEATVSQTQQDEEPELAAKPENTENIKDDVKTDQSSSAVTDSGNKTDSSKDKPANNSSDQNQTDSSADLTDEDKNPVKPGSDLSDTVNDNTDQNPDDSNENKDNDENQEALLYQSSLSSDSLGTIEYSAHGKEIRDPKTALILANALKVDPDDLSLYVDVLFTSTKDGFQASSDPISAVKVNNEGFSRFYTLEKDETQGTITWIQPASVRIDYASGKISFSSTSQDSVLLSGLEDPDDSANAEAGSDEKTDTANKNENTNQPVNSDNSSDSATEEKDKTETEKPDSEKNDSEQEESINTDDLPYMPDHSLNEGLALVKGSAEPQKNSIIALAAEVKPGTNTKAVQNGVGAIGDASSLSAVNKNNTSRKSDSSRIQPVNRLNSNAVNSFINTYCSNSTGQIYLQAWSANYKQIMSGYSVWKTLDFADKQAINARLAEVGSVSYTSLYRQAHRVLLGLGIVSSNTQLKKPTAANRPATATAEHGLTYSYMTVLFGSLCGLFLKKSLKKDPD